MRLQACIVTHLNLDAFPRDCRQPRKYVWLALLGLLAVHAAKTHVRNADWKDEYTIFTAGLKVRTTQGRPRKFGSSVLVVIPVRHRV